LYNNNELLINTQEHMFLPTIFGNKVINEIQNLMLHRKTDSDIWNVGTFFSVNTINNL